MPRKPKPSRRAKVLTLGSLSNMEWFDLMAGYPDFGERWEGWRHYLETWAAVRSEWFTVADGKGDAPYAEQIYQRYGTAPPPWFDGSI